MLETAAHDLHPRHRRGADPLGVLTSCLILLTHRQDAISSRRRSRIGRNRTIERGFAGTDGELRGMRMVVEGNYLLLYEYDAKKDEVDLVAVVDGRRELSGLF